MKTLRIYTAEGDKYLKINSVDDAKKQIDKLREQGLLSWEQASEYWRALNRGDTRVIHNSLVIFECSDTDAVRVPDDDELDTTDLIEE